MVRMGRLLVYVWVSPTSVAGLIVALLAAHRGGVAVVDGVLEAYGPMLEWILSRLPPGGGITAITLGHVVLGRDAAALAATRAHERVHVGQYERWGPLFVPAYLLSGLLALVRGGHPYFDNHFEREAFRRG